MKTNYVSEFKDGVLDVLDLCGDVTNGMIDFYENTLDNAPFIGLPLLFTVPVAYPVVMAGTFALGSTLKISNSIYTRTPIQKMFETHMIKKNIKKNYKNNKNYFSSYLTQEEDRINGEEYRQKWIKESVDRLSILEKEDYVKQTEDILTDYNPYSIEDENYDSVKRNSKLKIKSLTFPKRGQ